MASSTTPRDESDYDSSCSSITVPDSSRSWMSNLSFGSRRRSSSSSVSVCSTATAATATSHGSSKPHKANLVAWEAMRRLRLNKGRVGLDDFRLLRRLGSGDIGNVYLCQIRNPAVGLPQCLYAMKVVDREALTMRNKLQRAEMEKEILSIIDHPFLPTLYAEFEASHYSCLVMEFCPGGDLYVARLRQPARRFSISSAKFYAAETLVALEYLHMMGIVYRDLKPENVLIREDGHIMLSDFDLCLKCDVVPKLLRSKTRSSLSERSFKTRKSSTPSCASSPMRPVLSCFSSTTTKRRHNVHQDDEEPEASELVAEPINARSKSFVGTHEYLAPEVISGQGHGSAVDWWTFGVFLYEMVYGITPFKGETNQRTLMNILKQPLRFPRMTSSEKEVEEMRRVQDLIRKLLVKNPNKRIGSCMGSVEIKRHEFFKGVNWALIRSHRPPVVPRDHNNLNRLRSSGNGGSRVLLPKLSKKERDEPYRITPSNHHHFDYF